MTNKYAVFDLEIIKDVTGVADWWSVAPLGVSCGAVALSDSDNAIVWSGYPELGNKGLNRVVTGLYDIAKGGYTLVGFNSLGFDFRLLAIESDDADICEGLASDHIDMFFHLFCMLGYAPGLDTLCVGMGTPRKTKGVDGAKAPELWAKGERQAVIDYCVQDVRATLALLLATEDRGGVQWTSKSGKTVTCDFDRWLTVTQALSLPEPDNSWMKEPWKRDKFTGWMERYGKEKTRPNATE